MCGVDIGQTPRDFLFSGEPLSANRSPTGSSSSTAKLSCRAGVSMTRQLPVHRMGEHRMGWDGIRQLPAARCPIFLSFHVPPPVCPHHDIKRMISQGTEPVKAECGITGVPFSIAPLGRSTSWGCSPRASSSSPLLP